MTDQITVTSPLTIATDTGDITGKVKQLKIAGIDVSNAITSDEAFTLSWAINSSRPMATITLTLIGPITITKEQQA